MLGINLMDRMQFINNYIKSRLVMQSKEETFATRALELDHLLDWIDAQDVSKFEKELNRTAILNVRIQDELAQMNIFSSPSHELSFAETQRNYEDAKVISRVLHGV